MKNKKKNKNNEKNIMDIIIKIVLVVVIIILFMHNCSLMKERNVKPVSAGNIHIIEIKCNSTKTCEPVKPDDNKGNNKNNGKNNNNNDEQVIEGDDLIVYDSDIEWDGVTEAKIFTNSMYELEDVIAPESSNTYQFVVKNSSEYTLKYNIDFLEQNPYNVNMKYKLKKNDTYVINDYVSASELVAQNFVLPINSYDTFYLEWKWFSSSNDTNIGQIGDATYDLKMEVKAESING